MGKLDNLVKSLAQNPWIIVIPSAVTVIAFIYAIFVAVKSKKIKKPMFELVSSNLLSGLDNRFSKLKVHYGDENITNLTVTKVAFWNAGKETINFKDCAEADPILIKIDEGYKILDVSIIHTRNKANQLSVYNYDKHTQFGIKFDYLDHNDGCVIQVLHTGNSGTDLEVSGTVKSYGDLSKKNFYTDSFLTTNSMFGLLFVTSIGYFSGILAAKMANLFDAFIDMLGYTIVITAIYFILSRLKRFPKKCPRALDKYLHNL